MSITLILVIITCGISYYAFNNPSLMDKLILNPYKVTKRNEYYRFVTSGFVHADFGHLIFNMLSLWFVGEGIERLFSHAFWPERFYLLPVSVHRRDHRFGYPYIPETPEQFKL